MGVSSVFGIAGLAVAGMVGFEEPNSTLLLVSSLLILAAPLAMIVHLSVTRELTRQEKRTWIHALAGHRGPWVFSEYLTCTDRPATARRLAEESLERRRRLPGPPAGGHD